jgi:integrase
VTVVFGIKYRNFKENTVMPLTDIVCRNRKGSGKAQKLSDAEGLYLFISPSGGKLWRMDYRFAGKRKTLSFGAYPLVPLVEARSKRDLAKKALLDGKDPSVIRKAKQQELELSGANSFESVAREWLENQRDSWTEKYAGHVERRLESDVFPAFGLCPIADIDPLDVLEALRKVEKRGALDIAKRLRQTCGQIFRYAVITGRAKRDPSADLKGALKAGGRAKHHKAMAREDLPAFLNALQVYDGDVRTKLALQLIVLTFVRTSELRLARWSEFEGLDGPAPIWRIPAERMKMRSEHLVPLSIETVTVLNALRPFSGNSGALFPSKGTGGAMSNNTMLFALYRMGYHGRATVHGFRGLASTCLNEAGFPSDWIERQLSHDERDAVRRAYNSAQYLDDRRRMMCWWSDYLTKVTTTGNTAIGQMSNAA